MFLPLLVMKMGDMYLLELIFRYFRLQIGRMKNQYHHMLTLGLKGKKSMHLKIVSDVMPQGILYRRKNLLSRVLGVKHAMDLVRNTSAPAVLKELLLIRLNFRRIVIGWYAVNVIHSEKIPPKSIPFRL